MNLKYLFSGEPFIHGIATLMPVEGIPDVFCQNISFPNNTFSLIWPVHVIISVNWDTSETQGNNYVSAAWTEGVTHHGFKGCALVAGRFYRNSIFGKPRIHWLTYQKNINAMKLNITAGNVKMPVWLTGSRCVHVQLQVLILL